jgi:hypothetical protein
VTENDRSPSRPDGVRGVQYKGAPLDADRGPGLGCFRIQLVVLTVLVVLTPLSVVWGWPEAVSAALLIVVILLLLLTGQTIIFLLRLVAADRRAAGRRRPLASATPTVGELEDRERQGPGERDDAGSGDGDDREPGAGSEGEPDSDGGGPPPGDGRMRQ